MPRYEFQCEKCHKSFELICTITQYDREMKKKIKCPKCASSKVVRQISSFEVKTSKKS